MQTINSITAQALALTSEVLLLRFKGMPAGESVGKALHYALQCLPAMPAQQESDTLKVQKYTQDACLNSQSSAAFMPQSNAV